MSTSQIHSIHAPTNIGNTASANKTERAGSGFGDVLTEQLQRLNEQHAQADSAIKSLATGETDDINHVVMQMAEADLTFRMAIEIRNRLLESYQEIMRLQV